MARRPLARATPQARVGDRLSARDRAAVGAMRAVNGASRLVRLGEGTVAGGRVALRIAPGLLGTLSAHRAVGLVSGTNGKTTTTACLAAALRTMGAVATNETGSNMVPGHVAALGRRGAARFAALECDEVWLPTILATERPRAVVLLNLSRDQLDRTAEVRHVADAWRAALSGYDGTCVANADDPLVVHAAGDAARTAWFAGGLVWREDAVSCPRCVGRIDYDATGWRCACGLSRPTPQAELTTTGARVDGVEVALSMSLPGAFNGSNALGALLGAVRMGAAPQAAASAIGDVAQVAGRFSHLSVGGADVRLMLAKNPAGWAAVLDMVAAGDAPVVVAINARIADGHDPSWLYDVEFERLGARRVIATGERWRDVSARLFYAAVAHECAPDPHDAIALAARGATSVEVIANYTAFDELRGRAA